MVVPKRPGDGEGEGERGVVLPGLDRVDGRAGDAELGAERGLRERVTSGEERDDADDDPGDDARDGRCGQECAGLRLPDEAHPPR